MLADDDLVMTSGTIEQARRWMPARQLVVEGSGGALVRQRVQDTTCLSP